VVNQENELNEAEINKRIAATTKIQANWRGK